MIDRRQLPNRRAHTLINFDHAGFGYVGGVGLFDNGGIAEVFLNADKAGSTLDAAARDAAIVASLALQHGTPLATLQRALTRNSDGSASGPLGTFLDLLATEA
jgi:ribonucleoside-diphosphate reductase alpha chain